ncbi:uncharacterized protein [Epargyreus clarus]|uniref:uncharacterized protein n=1 Tax=Epargyreus clarus TaxID=520877 RepID=UPI003C2B3EF8
MWSDDIDDDIKMYFNASDILGEETMARILAEFDPWETTTRFVAVPLNFGQNTYRKMNFDLNKTRYLSLRRRGNPATQSAINPTALSAYDFVDEKPVREVFRSLHRVSRKPINKNKLTQRRRQALRPAQ